MTAHSRFQRWIVHAVQEAGAEVPKEVDPLGLSFEAEGRIVRIFPHADEAHAVIEVTANSLDDIADDDLGRLAVQLHRLNHEARFEHGWTIVLDNGNGLNVTTTVDITHTRTRMLADILYDGIDRAASLSAVVSGLASVPASTPEPRPVAGPHHHHSIRG